MARVLVVEDEERLARSLLVGLRDEGYVVDHAKDGREALWRLDAEHHDLVLLDLRLPHVDGLEVCRRLRARAALPPILMLTASDTTQDVVRGLDLGADDYLTKPFQFAELLARVRALLRRGVAGAQGRLQVADLELDPHARRAWRAGREIVMTNLEYRLLEHLLRHAGSVQSKSRLAAALWQDEVGPDSNVLEVLVSSLRRKLERDQAPPLLHTRRGAGYYLAEETR